MKHNYKSFIVGNTEYKQNVSKISTHLVEMVELMLKDPRGNIVQFRLHSVSVQVLVAHRDRLGSSDIDMYVWERQAALFAYAGVGRKAKNLRVAHNYFSLSLGRVLDKVIAVEYQYSFIHTHLRRRQPHAVVLVHEVDESLDPLPQLVVESLYSMIGFPQL